MLVNLLGLMLVYQRQRGAIRQLWVERTSQNSAEGGIVVRLRLRLTPEDHRRHRRSGRVRQNPLAARPACAGAAAFPGTAS